MMIFIFSTFFTRIFNKIVAVHLSFFENNFWKFSDKIWKFERKEALSTLTCPASIRFTCCSVMRFCIPELVETAPLSPLFYQSIFVGCYRDKTGFLNVTQAKFSFLSSFSSPSPLPNKKATGISVFVSFRTIANDSVADLVQFPSVFKADIYPNCRKFRKFKHRKCMELNIQGFIQVFFLLSVCPHRQPSLTIYKPNFSINDFYSLFFFFSGQSWWS